MNNLIQLVALTVTQVDSVPDESPFTCLLRCMLRAHTPGPAATLKHCSHWPQGTGPHILSVLPAEDTCSPSPPGCMAHKSSPLPSESPAAQLTLTSTPLSPAHLRFLVLNPRRISPSYTFFSVTNTVPISGSAHFLCNWPDSKLLDSVAVRCLSPLSSATMNITAATEIGE